MIVDYLSTRPLSIQTLSRQNSDLCREAEVGLIALTTSEHIANGVSTPPAVHTR